MQVFEDYGRAEKHEKIVPGNTATGIAAANLTSSGLQPKAALITVEDNTVNFSIHGTAPTAAAGTNVGHSLAAGDSILLRGANDVKNFKCIDRVAGSAGTVKVTVFF